MKKTFITIMSVLMLLCSIMGLVACGETPQDENEQGLAFFLQDDGTYSVGIGNAEELSKIVIPATYNGKAVTKIKDNFANGSKQLTEITIPNSIKTIGNTAFTTCSSLTKVNYTGDIDGWCEIEFSGSSSNPLYYAKNLYINDTLVTEANITNATKINDYAFYNCSSLTEVTIPNSVEEIGSYAFNNCSSLTSITIGNSVKTIGKWAFYFCETLTKVNYTGDIDSWCEIKFSNFASNPLEYANNLYINNTLVTEANITKATKINDDALHGCSSLTVVIIGNSVKEIGSSAFRYCSSLISVTIGSGVKEIGDEAFYNCSSLTSVKIGDSVKEIESYAFHGCSSLTEVTIPESVTSIGSYAFYECSSLTRVTILGGSIGEHAFEDCSSLTSVTILGGSIGEHAFEDCSSLTEVTIGEATTSIGGYAFLDCSSLTKVNYTGDIDSWCEIEFGIYYSNPLEYANNLYINDKLVTEANITKATKINVYAFRYCSSLTKVTIGNSVKEIGRCTFIRCKSLTSITIGNCVTSLDCYAFRGCSSLTSVTFSDSSNWYSISTYHDNAYENWQNKTGGTLIDFSSPSKNATYFKSNDTYYSYYYWYKLDK